MEQALLPMAPVQLDLMLEEKNSCVQGTAGFRRAWHPTLIGGYRREVDSPGSFFWQIAPVEAEIFTLHILHPSAGPTS